MVSAVDGEGYRWYMGGFMFRKWPYRFFEKVMFSLIGINNYIKLWRSVTWGTVKLFWTFNVKIERWYIWLLYGLLQLGLLYGSFTSTATSTAALLLYLTINVVLLPLHAVAYLYQNYLILWPHAFYTHPQLDAALIGKIEKREEKEKKAEEGYQFLKKLKDKKKLPKAEERKFEVVKRKKINKLLKLIGA